MTGTARIIHGNALDLPLPDESVDLVVTSPPYWSLRQYTDNGTAYERQIGAEDTAAEFIDNLVAATAEMVRVLKPTGSAFVNLGDKYGPDKSLLMLPERYRIAIRDRLGVIVRATVIWSKPNGLPESVTDRVRRSHEDWVHFTKSPRYFSAVDEIREAQDPANIAHHARYRGRYEGTNPNRKDQGTGNFEMNPLGKLPGSVWDIPTQPLRVPDHLGIDHFAAFPMEFPRRIIRGWSPEGGTVLDPFGGTGTTALVARAWGRHGISVDFSHDYCRLATWRTNDRDQLAAAMQVDKPNNKPLEGQLGLFGDDAA